MPRPEAPLAGNGPVVDLARALRDLRASAGNPGYRELAEELHYSPATLSRATSGKQLPTWPVVEALARHFGGNVQVLELMWRNAARQHMEAEPSFAPGEGEDRATPPEWSRLRPARSSRVTPKLVLILVGLGFLLPIVLGVAIALPSVQYAPAQSSVDDAVILSPAGDRVGSQVQLFGRIDGLHYDELLWAATFDPATGLFLPQDKPCVVSAESFNCGTYYFGSTPGKYTIVLFAANAQASNAVLQYQINKGGPTGSNPGLVALPDGTRKIGSKPVLANCGDPPVSVC